MPCFNGKGPSGDGPATGRGLGTCGGNVAFAGTRQMGRGGRGCGRGLAYGRGNQRGRTPFFSSDDIRGADRVAFVNQGLKQRQAMLSEELARVNAALGQNGESSGVEGSSGSIV